MRANGVLEQRPQTARRGSEISRTFGVFRGSAARRVPPGTGAWSAAAIRQVQQEAMAGGQQKNVFDQRDGFRNAAEEEKGCQCVRRQTSRYEIARQKRAQLRREHKSLRGLRII